MKKLVSLLLAIVMLLGICGVSAAEGKTVLTVASWDTTTGGYLAATETAFEAAYPDIDLQYVDVASQDYNIKPTTMLGGGDTTDVFDVKELSDLQNWIAQGYVDDLEANVTADSYDLSHYLGMEKYYRGLTDEKLYALPYRSDFWVLFYNKTLFDKAGVAYPTNDMTWEAYADLARSMTSGEGIDKIYGTHYHTWLSAVCNWAVCDGVYTLADGNYDPLTYFYNLTLGLEDEGVCQAYTELKAANLHYSAAFYQGNIAMLPMGYWFAATLINEKKKGTYDFDWSFVAVPHMDGVPAGSSFGSLTGACINKNALHKDAAWKFVAWRASEEGAKAIAAVGTRPAYVSKAVATLMASAEGFPTDDACRAALVPAQMSIEWPVGDKVSELKTIVNEEHTLIMSREISVADGVAEMNSRAAELLAQ
ncbi:MAG: extracellular solute-binding protein [Eubacteriales bacterium]|nr:extracellular solute-binding protein [Eubacteriales bacterium]